MRKDVKNRGNELGQVLCCQQNCKKTNSKRTRFRAQSARIELQFRDFVAFREGIPRPSGDSLRERRRRTPCPHWRGTWCGRPARSRGSVPLPRAGRMPARQQARRPHHDFQGRAGQRLNSIASQVVSCYIDKLGVERSLRCCGGGFQGGGPAGTKSNSIIQRS